MFASIIAVIVMGNDDAMLAMLASKDEVKPHMKIMRHSTMERASGKAHVVMSSKHLLGKALHVHRRVHDGEVQVRKLQDLRSHHNWPR